MMRRAVEGRLARALGTPGIHPIDQSPEGLRRKFSRPVGRRMDKCRLCLPLSDLSYLQLTGQSCFDTLLTSPGVDRAPRKSFHVANGASMFIAGQRPFVLRNGRRIGDVDSGPWLESSRLDEQVAIRLRGLRLVRPNWIATAACASSCAKASRLIPADLRNVGAHLDARLVSSKSSDRCPKPAVDAD